MPPRPPRLPLLPTLPTLHIFRASQVRKPFPNVLDQSKKSHHHNCVYCVITPCNSLTLLFFFFFEYYFRISLSLLFPPAVWLQHLRVIQIPTLPTLRHLETQQFPPISARHPPQSPFHQVPPPTICFSIRLLNSFFVSQTSITECSCGCCALFSPNRSFLPLDQMCCSFKPLIQLCLLTIFGMFGAWRQTVDVCLCFSLPKMFQSWKRANPVDVECRPRQAAYGKPDV